MSLLDRFRGLMVGGLVGDCLGRPFEGHKIVPEHLIDEVVERSYLMRYTDDTVVPEVALSAGGGRCLGVCLPHGVADEEFTCALRAHLTETQTT